MSHQIHRQDGAAIRRIRQQSGLKTGQLAETAGVARSTLVGIENGSGQASVELLYRLAKALDVPIKDLLSDAGRAELADDLKAAS